MMKRNVPSCILIKDKSSRNKDVISRMELQDKMSHYHLLVVSSLQSKQPSDTKKVMNNNSKKKYRDSISTLTTWIIIKSTITYSPRKILAITSITRVTIDKIIMNGMFIHALGLEIQASSKKYFIIFLTSANLFKEKYLRYPQELLWSANSLPTKWVRIDHSPCRMHHHKEVLSGISYTLVY